MTTYRTRDFNKISFLKAKSYKIFGYEEAAESRTDKPVIDFVFEDTPELHQALLDYDNKSDLTHARDLQNAEQEVKDIIYDAKNRIRNGDKLSTVTAY